MLKNDYGLPHNWGIATSLVITMPKYSIDTHTSRSELADATAMQAIEAAGRVVYLQPAQFGHHIQRLNETGRTAWAYGFSSVVVTLEPA
jgi:hypothetical protein